MGAFGQRAKADDYPAHTLLVLFLPPTAALMRRLAAVATVFLPITFLTGYFGQNFAFMVRHVDGADAFVLGTLMQLAVAVGVVVFLRVRRWI